HGDDGRALSPASDEPVLLPAGGGLRRSQRHERLGSRLGPALVVDARRTDRRRTPARLLVPAQPHARRARVPRRGRRVDRTASRQPARRVRPVPAADHAYTTDKSTLVANRIDTITGGHYYEHAQAWSEAGDLLLAATVVRRNEHGDSQRT